MASCEKGYKEILLNVPFLVVVFMCTNFLFFLCFLPPLCIYFIVVNFFCHDPIFEASKNQIVTKKTKSKKNKILKEDKVGDENLLIFKSIKRSQRHQN